MRVLVTRPEADAQRTIAALAARGHDGVPAPLTRIDALHPDMPTDGVEALLATSARAFETLGDVPADVLALPVYCVGARTADAARARGFHVEDPPSPDVEALDARLAGLKQGRFLYLAARHRKPILEQSLVAHGHRVDAVVVYAASPVASMPPQSRAALAGDRVDAVLHYSRRHAAIFWEVAETEGLGAKAATLLHVCISEDVAAIVRPVAQQVRIAATPDEDALLDALDAP